MIAIVNRLNHHSSFKATLYLHQPIEILEDLARSWNDLDPQTLLEGHRLSVNVEPLSRLALDHYFSTAVVLEPLLVGVSASLVHVLEHEEEPEFVNVS